MARLNSKTFPDMTGLSRIDNKLNRNASADNLVKFKVHKKPTSEYLNPGLSPQSASSRGVAATGKSVPSKVETKLGNAVKQVLVTDDDLDSAITIRSCLESYFMKDEHGLEFRALEVTMFSNPVTALLEFKPYRYDLLLVDINMPTVNGYDLAEKITKLDLNIKVCFMSSGEVNYEAMREIRHPVKSLGCFIRKPATRDYLINRVIQELF